LGPFRTLDWGGDEKKGNQFAVETQDKHCERNENKAPKVKSDKGVDLD